MNSIEVLDYKSALRIVLLSFGIVLFACNSENSGTSELGSENFNFPDVMSPAPPSATPSELPPVTPAEAAEIAAEAYIYGYPMVQMHKMWFAGILSGFLRLPFGGYVPNQVVNFTELLTPDNIGVASPNNDTLYSPLFLDLRAEPVVLSVPPVPTHYYCFQFLDYFTNNVAYVGTRTTGREAGNYLIVGPDNRSIPEEVVQMFDGVIDSPSQFMLALGRTRLICESNDPGCIDGLAEVEDIQAGYQATTLSEYPPTDGLVPQPRLVEPLWLQVPLGVGGFGLIQEPTLLFFHTLNWALARELPFPSENEMLARFSRIGVEPGRPYNLCRFSPDVLLAMQAAIVSRDQELKVASETPDSIQGWALYSVDQPYFATPPAYSDTDYDFRAKLAKAAICVNDPKEALYYFGYFDKSNVDKLNGQNTYTIRFESDAEFPEAQFFWSFTMYGANQLLVENCIDRYSLGSGNALEKAADGSTTLVFSNEVPASFDCEENVNPNWLPAPGGEFYVILRVFGPSAADLDPDDPYVPPPFVLQDI